MKKITKFFVLPMLMICSLFTLVACGETPTPDGIELHSSFRTEYYIGESLDLAGGILEYTHEGITIPVAIEESMVSGFTTEMAGTREMVVTYETYAITVSYSVRDTIFELNTAYRSTVLMSEVFDNDNDVYLYVWFISGKTMLMTSSVEVPEEVKNSQVPTGDNISVKTYNDNIVDGRLVVDTEFYGGGKYIITKITSGGFEFSMVAGSPEGGVPEEIVYTFTMVKVK